MAVTKGTVEHRRAVSRLCLKGRRRAAEPEQNPARLGDEIA